MTPLVHSTTKAYSSGDCFIPTNYKRIMAKVAAKPLESANLRLGTIMASLKVVKATNGSRSQVELRTTDGAQELFDTAVVTTPLGWLKHHKDAIQPLSDRISRAIDSLSFGNLEKVSHAFYFVLWPLTYVGSHRVSLCLLGLAPGRICRRNC